MTAPSCAALPATEGRRPWAWAAHCVLCAAALAAAPARAHSLDIQHGRAAINEDGLHTVEGARTAAPWRARAALQAVYTKQPVVLRAGRRITANVVEDQLGLVLSFGLGLLPTLDVGASLQVVPLEHLGARYVGGGFVPERATYAGLVGDLWLQARWAPLRQEAHGVDLALVPQLRLPSTMHPFVSDGAVVGAPQLNVGRRLGPAHALVNLGALLRRPASADGLTFGTQGLWRAGLGVHLGPLGVPQVELMGEAFGLVDRAQAPTEWLAGVRLALAGWQLVVGAGRSVLGGYGAPTLRGSVQLAYLPRLSGGAPAAATATAPEPTRPGVIRPLDSDGDGILNRFDVCWEAAEDYRAPQPGDGCPAPPDRDGDGIPDERDACPDQPAAPDHAADSDGCPPADSDGDGIPDTVDRCPHQAEVINGVDDEDGCPDAGEALVELTDHQTVELRGNIVYFGVGQARLLPRATAALDQLAALLHNHRDLRLAVVGYTDARGGSGVNRRLARRRALSVRAYLVRQGIAAGRLEARAGGLGTYAGNEDGRGRALNRRVSLEVIGAGRPAGARRGDMPAGGAQAPAPASAAPLPAGAAPESPQQAPPVPPPPAVDAGQVPSPGPPAPNAGARAPSPDAPDVPAAGAPASPSAPDVPAAGTPAPPSAPDVPAGGAPAPPSAPPTEDSKPPPDGPDKPAAGAPASPPPPGAGAATPSPDAPDTRPGSAPSAPPASGVGSTASAPAAGSAAPAPAASSAPAGTPVAIDDDDAGAPEGDAQ